MSNVAPVRLADLPDVPRALAEAGRPLARLVARHPRELQVALRAVGVVVLRAARVCLAHTGEGAADTARDRIAVEEVWLVQSGGSLRLTIDAALARAVVSAALGLRQPLFARPLGGTERGVLAALIGQVMRALAGSDRFRVAFNEPSGAGPRPDATVVAADLDVRAAGVSGLVRVELMADQLDGISGGLHSERLADLSLALVTEVSRTTLSAMDVASAAPGDAIVFAGSPALGGGAEDWPVSTRLGSVCVLARFDAEGGLHVTQQHAHGVEATVNMSKDRDAAPTAAVTAALAGVPVEVVAEVGRLMVRADELAGFLAGAVLPLGIRRTDAVTLRVGDRAWARGELVNVDGELGVRVTELLR